ncbi:OLC1v1005917C1 [Oldenlandia corymbosa var. corymbosa]|uniref:OLC1v1005917C1 n=1 Tax=Oldenlandia corymbosa var. corymbosa TaxID=529605 RepID=A0AAV1DI62_OLDCO|nr:OLC1v1005917C1 [Oldenlandia corymbosa var. corymbosa]
MFSVPSPVCLYLVPATTPPEDLSTTESRGNWEATIQRCVETPSNRGPTIAVHTFGDPPTIECSLLEEFTAQLTEIDSVRLMSAASMTYLMCSRELRQELVQARAERDQALIEKVALEKKAQQVEVKEQELASVQAKYNELDKKLKEYGNLHISKDLPKWCAAFWFRMLSTGEMAAVIEEINMAATKYGGHGVAVAGLKSFLCGALAKMSIPGDVGAFLSDIAAVLARGFGEELPIPDVPDEYIGIELEDEDDVTSEERDTGNSGAKDKDPPVEGNAGGAT